MRKTIIIVIIILVAAAICVGILFWVKSQPVDVNLSRQLPPTNQLLPAQNSSSSAQNNPSVGGSILVLGDASIPAADISSTLPADSPAGPTISFQAASGTIILKNFYNQAQGYWFDLDMILLQHTTAYTLWYYRGDSSFEIDLPESGYDQAAAESALAQDLGVGQQTLCSLPVTVELTFDRSNSDQVFPLKSCPQQSL